MLLGELGSTGLGAGLGVAGGVGVAVATVVVVGVVEDGGGRVGDDMGLADGLAVRVSGGDGVMLPLCPGPLLE